MPEATEKSVLGTVERVLGSTVRMNEGRPSIISEGFSFTGDITADHVLHVEGRIEGKIHVGAVVVGPNGCVKGSVRCTRFHVKGVFEGILECEELELESSARVDGTIEYRVLNVQRGAVVRGEMIVRRGAR